jgi:nucleoside-diphosphate-sugar epimerase
MFNILLEKDIDHIISHLDNIFGNLMGKRIFITGGTGFFGKWILETLAKANEDLRLNLDVLILTRNINAFRLNFKHLCDNKIFEFLEGDVNNFEYPEGKFDFVIHAATDSDSELYRTKPLLMFDTILNGTRNILDFAVKSEAKYMLYISSGAVYGKQPPELSHISEEYLGSPQLNDINSAYSEGKRAAEMLCALYSSRYGFSVKIARCFAFTGPYLLLDKHFAIGNFMNDFLKHKPIIIKSDGTAVRSYLYSADLIIWLLTILVKGLNCRPYNVGSEFEISIQNLAEMISAISDKPLEVRILANKDRITIPERYVPSTRRARKELGLSQTIDINDSISRTLNFHLAAQKH